MGANIVGLLLSAVVIQAPPPDSTSSFASPSVHQLVERAMSRRRVADASVTDYRATIRYRLSLGVGERVWARIPASAVEEQVARVQWQQPNDLRVDVIGRRLRSRDGSPQLTSVWDRPWFVPRGVDDSVRVFSNDFPATGALHPLARTGPEWYRYALTGDLTVTPASGPPLRLLRVSVTPRRPRPALIAGQMWIDSASAEVVRLTFRYLGTELWVRPEAGPRGPDSSRARRLNALGNRIVSVDADLEYALEAGAHWMPYRQVIAGRVRLPIGLVIPFRATTTFEDYEIGGGPPIAFEVPLSDSVSPARADSLRAERRRRRAEEPDSLRAWDYAGRWPGGRYELHRPSNVDLERYGNWPDTLTLEDDPAESHRLREVEAELARLSEALPDSVTGQAARGIAYERLSDAVRYDRVQGLSFGIGYRVRAPGLRFSSLYATIRYGLSDERLTGRLSLVRDAPGGRLVLSGYRDIGDVDPFSPGHTVGNALNALFVAHDDADYAVVRGGSATFETSVATGLDLRLTAQAERQTSAGRQARSAVNDFLGGDGRFLPNPPVDEGTFGGGQARLTHRGATRWMLAADVLSAGRTTGRAYGELRRDVGGRRGVTIRLRSGVATAPTLQQSLFRLGGPATVRGFDYGFRRGQAFWAGQLDIAPFRGRLRPVAFIDAGQADRLDALFSGPALVGAGVGLSVFNGVFRMNLSHPVTPDPGGKVRFDLVVQAMR
jgi:hypothetical protein